MTTRLLFAGTPEVAVPSLKAFAADPRFEIAAVIAYGNILPKVVLDAVPMGWWNLHFSNLPRWRGAAPAQRAIWAGDATCGADVFKVGEGLDDGPIVASMSVELTDRETSGELLERLAVEGAPMYVDALASVVAGTATLTPQDDDGAVYAHKITVEDARVSFADDVAAIDRQIRACTPNPGAWAGLDADGNGETEPVVLHILAAQPADTAAPNTPGDLKPGTLRIGKRNVWVGTGTPGHPLELLQVKAQGKKAMRAADWARGARLGENAKLV